MPLIEITTEGGNEVIVAECDETKVETAAATFDYLVLNDGATVKQTFDGAGTGHADIIITTTDKDMTNIMVYPLVKEPDIPGIVSVVHNSEHMSPYHQIGTNTMENPRWLITEYLCCAVKHLPIVDYICIGEHVEAFEIRVDEDVPIARMTIQETAQENLLDGGTLIVAVECEGDGDPVTPRGDTAVSVGDLLTAYPAKGVTPEVTDVLSYYEDH